jgi:hypothetical protein
MHHYVITPLPHYPISSWSHLCGLCVLSGEPFLFSEGDKRAGRWQDCLSDRGGEADGKVHRLGAGRAGRLCGHHLSSLPCRGTADAAGHRGLRYPLHGGPGGYHARCRGRGDGAASHPARIGKIKHIFSSASPVALRCLPHVRLLASRAAAGRRDTLARRAGVASAWLDSSPAARNATGLGLGVTCAAGAERRRVFVARSRHKNFVELNRCAIPFGILIQPVPLEKRFRGGVGGWPMRLGGGKGDEGQCTGVEWGPARWWCRGLPKTVFERRTHQCLGATADRPGYGDADRGGRPGGNWGPHGGPLWSGGRARMKTNRPWPQRGHGWPARRGTHQGSSGQVAGAGASGDGVGSRCARQS